MAREQLAFLHALPASVTLSADGVGRVLFVHALRNALIPVTTIVAIDFAALVGGAVVTEIVFSWYGMGQYLLNALTGAESPDVYAVQGWLMVAGAAVIVFNILADLIYGLLDPRVRYA